MKVLFILKHPGAVRSLDSVLRMLDERGHQVHLALAGIKPDAHRVLQHIADDCQGLTFGRLPARGSPGWTRDWIGWNQLAKVLRAGSDYLRYLEPTYADAPALRARAEVRAHPWIRRATRVAGLGGPVGRRALHRTIDEVEHCLRPPPHVERFLSDFDPDVMLVTNLARDSVQVDYVRAAKRLGIHTGYPVFSWDNLTNKGLVHELPELVLVWNDLQAEEAVSLHQIPRDRVRVLGAWSYDHWFGWGPSCSREKFCRKVGLRADRPIILYVCSSEFVAPDEVAFVRRWIGALRGHEELAEAGVLVRPHPRNASRWADAVLDEPQATIWPHHGEEPLEAASRRNYFDSIYHAAAVVGINTSAQIESAIVGRPVHTILAEEFRETQQGTLHFRYLKADDYGHLHVGRTMGEHLEQLAASLTGPPDDARNERFVRRFVRPLGLDVAAGGLYVDTVEELAGLPALAPDRGPVLAPAVRLALAPFAALARRRVARRREQPRSQPDDLRDAVRKLKRGEGQAPVVAGPWLGSEIAELLYWIPFLRWVQLSTFGVRDRLVVITRAASASWYVGIGSKRVHVEDVPSGYPAADKDVLLLQPGLIEDRRKELAAEDPSATFLRRRLEFQLMSAPDLPPDFELPEEFVAVRFDGKLARAGAALAEWRSIVPLDELDGSVKAAVLARSSGFAGTYGVEAYLSVLLGVPAVAFCSESDQASEHDLRVVSSLLARPPFGRLHVLDAPGDAAEAADRVQQLLGPPAGRLQVSTSASGAEAG